MPQPSEPTLFSAPLVCVIDTSVLIEFKRIVKIEEQWDLLVHMAKLVADGSLAFPWQVVGEFCQVRFPDAPGAWISSATGRVRHPEPREEPS